MKWKWIHGEYCRVGANLHPYAPPNEDTSCNCAGCLQVTEEAYEEWLNRPLLREILHSAGAS